MQRKLATISPLALLTLAACGGSSSGGGSSVAVSLTNFAGNAVKGPLQNAFVFLDLDGDGAYETADGEKGVWTDADGGYSITSVDQSKVGASTVLRVFTKDVATAAGITGAGAGNTIDTLTDADVSGIQLSAPDDATMVTPMTTLVAEAGLDATAVASALGLAGFDILNDDPSTSLAAEKAAHQVMNAITALSAAGEGAGRTADASFTAAVNAIADVVTTASGASQTVDLTGSGTYGLDAVMTSFKTELGGDVSAITAVEDAVVGAISSVNTKVDQLESLDGTAEQLANYLADGGDLASQIETAVSDGDASGISVDDNLVQLTADGEDVTTVVENLEADAVVGDLSAIGDADVSEIEIVESDISANFKIVEKDGGGWELQIADGADLAVDADTEIVLGLKVTSSDGSVSISQFTLTILDTAEFDGSVVKGPLEDALVFIDVDGDGEWNPEVDSAQVRTDETGAFSVAVYIPEGAAPEIVAVSDGTARDASSGEYLTDGTTLSAPEGASVVTPMTTLIAEADLSSEDVAAALGLPDGVDPLTYNPYAEGNDAADALAVEKVAHQVMNTVSSLKVAGEEAGLSASAALEKSMEAFKTVIVAAKAAQEADPDAAIKINFSDSADETGYGLSALVDDFSDKLANADAEDFETPPVDLAAARTAAQNKVDFVKASVIDGVATVNDLVESIPEGTALTLENTREFFSVGTKLAEEVKSAVENGNANAITVDNPTIAKAVGSNEAASKIELKSEGEAVVSIAENPTAGDVVGVLSADDTGNLTYELVGGGAASNFDIVVDSGDAKLVVADGAVIDAEADSGAEMSFKIKVSDSLGKSHVESFTLSITNVEEAPSIEITEVDVEQNASLSQDLKVFDPEGKDVALALVEPSDLFEIQDGTLVSSRAITQEDVDGGDQTLTIRMTDSGTGLDTTHDILVNIKNVNDDPVFVTTSIADGVEGASYSQSLRATDVDGDIVSFRLVEGPEWLSISGNTLSGTVPSDDAAIAEAVTVKIAAEDSNGGEAVQNFSLFFENVNDAPQFYQESITATVTETADAVGVDDAQEADNVSFTLNVLDPDSDASELVVSLSGGVERADGTFAKVGDFGTLSFDPASNSYVYTPDEEKIEPLHNESVTESFKFMVTDGELSDSLTLNVEVFGANDNPRIADQSEQNFVDLGDGQTDTIIGEVKVLDGSQYAGFTLAEASDNNDNASFDINDEGLLVLASGVQSENLAVGDLLVEVVAQDFDADGNPVDGTAAETSTFLRVKKVEGDPAPTILDISTDYDGSPLMIGRELNFTVTLSETAASGGSATLTLSNGQLVTVEVGDADSQFLNGTYRVESGDNDATATDTLEVTGFSSGSVVDLSTDGQGVVAGNTFNDLGDILVDANAPTAKITGDGAQGHTYATSTGKLILQGSGLGTIVADASRDVTSIVDWTKLEWNVDGLGATTRAFIEDDILSAKVNDEGTQLTVTLSESGKTALHGLDGFGGTAATGGVADAINVGVGFMRDLAGNLSSENSTASSGVTLSDVASPVLNEIDISGAFTSAQGAGRVRGDTFIVGDTITFTASMSDANELQDNEDMQVKLTLSNDMVLNLTRPDGATGADKVFSADYIIQDGDSDVSELAVASYAVQNIVDISGNPATNSKSLELVSKTFSGMASDAGVAVDANAPTAKLLGTEANPHTYDAASGELVLKGESLGTVVVDTVSRDIVDTVDWSKLQWNVDGNGSTTLDFTSEDVTSAVVSDDGTELTVTMSASGKVALQALSGFGGTGSNADTIDVSSGLLRDGAGNLSSAASTATSAVELLDETAPVLGSIDVFGEFTSTQVSGRVAGDAFIAGDTLTYSATIDEATSLQDSENMSVKLTLTNNKVLTLLRAEGADGSDMVFSADYNITEGDTDDGDLGVKSYTLENISDISGNAADGSVALGEITQTFGGMVGADPSDVSGETPLPIIVDANAPTAKVLGSEANPHTYDAAAGELVLQGESLRTVLTEGNDVKEIVDWSELVWNVDGLGSTTMAFEKADVDTAVVDADGETLTITLTADGKAALHGLAGFGGVEATGGAADVINVGGGFLRDEAGNVSSEVSTSASIVSLSDVVAPVLSTLTISSHDTSSEVLVGAVDDPATADVDETIIKFQAVFTDAGGELADDAQMVLTLNNGASVTMTKSQETGEDLYLVGELDVVSGQGMDTFDADGAYVALDVDNIDVSDVRDEAGNEAASDALLDAVDFGLLEIDTIAPNLQQAVLNTGTNEMIFVFDEILSEASITSLITAIDAVEELSGSASSGTTNTKITATFAPGEEGVPENGDTMPFTISFDDLAGNTTSITEFEIGII